MSPNCAPIFDCAAGRRSEGGVILPIVAVMALALITTIVVLGIETSRVKNAAAILQREAERICRLTAQSAFIPDEAVTIFSNEIRVLPEIDGATKLTAVRLILPLPLDAEATNVSNLLYRFHERDTNRPGTACSGASFQPGSSRTLSFASLSRSCIGSPALDSNVECQLQTSICDIGAGNGEEPNPNYPPTMWSNVANASNTVACEFDAVVDSILRIAGPSRRISAKAVWWSPLRPEQPYLRNTTQTVTGPQQQDFAGLSIGIAPELTTWTSSAVSVNGQPDGRFEFSAVYPTEIQAVNPRRAFTTAPPRRFNFLSPSLSFDSTFEIPGLDGAALSDSQRAELLTACVNPLTLVRNIILSTIVELAGRHGQTRNLTEITMINPTHQAPWTSLNRPVIMVPFGQDLMEQSYQHPFVTYFGGGANSQFGDKFGFTLPWLVNGSPYPIGSAGDLAAAHYHALVAQQLRMCYHLWDSDLTPRLIFPLHSFALLPPEFNFSSSLQGTQANIAPAWDYPSPWTIAAPSSVRRVNAPELVSSLGSVQFCPATLSGTPGFADCVRSNFQSQNDLLPDLVSYLAYQAGVPFPAGSYPYPSPGLYPPRGASGTVISSSTPDSDNPLFINPPPATQALPRSLVLIAVHKGLFSSTARDTISTLVSHLNALGRPVIILFMPATTEDSNTVDQYCRALNKGAGCAADNMNRLFFLSPWNSSYGAMYSSQGTPAQVFTSYWADLLDNSGGVDDPYVYTIARNIFSNSIVRHEPKL